MKTGREQISVTTRAMRWPSQRGAFDASVHPLNEHLSLALFSLWTANASRYAHPFRQRHPANGGRRCDAMPIKHQNDALLRQLYGVTADARGGDGSICYLSAVISKDNSTPRPMHRGAPEGRRLRRRKMKDGGEGERKGMVIWGTVGKARLIYRKKRPR